MARLAGLAPSQGVAIILPTSAAPIQTVPLPPGATTPAAAPKLWMPAGPAAATFLPSPAMLQIPLPAARLPRARIPAGKPALSRVRHAASARLTAPAGMGIFAPLTLALIRARLPPIVLIPPWPAPTLNVQAPPVPAWPIRPLPVPAPVLTIPSAGDV